MNADAKDVFRFVKKKKKIYSISIGASSDLDQEEYNCLSFLFFPFFVLPRDHDINGLK